MSFGKENLVERLIEVTEKVSDNLSHSSEVVIDESHLVIGLRVHFGIEIIRVNINVHILSERIKFYIILLLLKETKVNLSLG